MVFPKLSEWFSRSIRYWIKEAMEALKQWRFRPAEVAGQAVSTEAGVEFRFELAKISASSRPVKEARRGAGAGRGSGVSVLVARVQWSGEVLNL